jgi:phytoene synthase
MSERTESQTENEGGGSNFSLAFLFLSKAKRSAIRTVYAFCRTVDDIVDKAEDREKAAEELLLWEKEVESCYGGEPSLPLARELAETVRRFRIPKEPLLFIIEGVRMDLTVNRYPTFSDLRKYCDRVAGAVGLVSMRIFGPSGKAADAYALDLGCALQIINICRDVGTDADRGRIYLPLEDLARHGVSEEEILRKKYSPAFRDLMKTQAARAREFLSRADSTIFGRDRSKILPAEIMAGIYRRLLVNIESSDYAVLDRRIRVSTVGKILEALRAWLR